MNSAIAFFVGVAPDLKDHEAVLDEASREGDIVVLNFTDSYKTLTHKFLHGTKWVSDNCLLEPSATVVKLDDDVLVNLFALSAYLNSGVMSLPGIHCQVISGARPFRLRKSKWYVRKQDYASETYPSYCAGAAFIMQPSILFALYEASTHVPFFWVDDVYVTGILGEYANVTLVQMVEYIIAGKGRKTPAVKETTIFLHTGWYVDLAPTVEVVPRPCLEAASSARWTAQSCAVRFELSTVAFQCERRLRWKREMNRHCSNCLLDPDTPTACD
ncbi:hypothetical protein HPB51_005236 [Rhipicephalus microplus]|uniref:Hexosyltransferase n=1 Tax=Rhipicephalus microplus TaxID=6941 RepID=A0A9J6EXW5_RHIMP|nr:hypothetical protein HPB51_005236 [Rhipicephalus microplus]